MGLDRMCAGLGRVTLIFFFFIHFFVGGGGDSGGDRHTSWVPLLIMHTARHLDCLCVLRNGGGGWGA